MQKRFADQSINYQPQYILRLAKLSAVLFAKYFINSNYYSVRDFQVALS